VARQAAEGAPALAAKPAALGRQQAKRVDQQRPALEQLAAVPKRAPQAKRVTKPRLGQDQAAVVAQKPVLREPSAVLRAKPASHPAAVGVRQR
jgi:hypothetical protein